MMTMAELDSLRVQLFPDAKRFATLESLDEQTLVMRMPFRPELAREGGTVSGPALMALADSVVYYLLLAHGAPHASVTSNLDIHFLARPDPVDVLATARLLRQGKRLAVATVEMRSDGNAQIIGDVVAHATVTYALPRVTPP